MVLRCGSRAHPGLGHIRALLQLFAAVAIRDTAGTSIATFLLVLVLQHTEFRQTKTIQLKLDELLRAMERARTDLVHLEATPDENIERLDQEFEHLQEQASKLRPNSRKSG